MNHIVKIIQEEDKLEKLKGICPTCGSESEFVYEGFQEGYRNEGFEIYSCLNCNTSINRKRILKND